MPWSTRCCSKSVLQAEDLLLLEVALLIGLVDWGYLRRKELLELTACVRSSSAGAGY
jgi:hypothetical protein